MEIMAKYCSNCGKKLIDSRLTHCSEKCIFETVSVAKSLSNVPILFDMDSKPWT